MEREEIFRRIYDNQVDRVFSYFALCFGEIDAQDCTQQVFLKLWQTMNGEGYCAPDNERAWLFRVAVNIKNDVLRRKMKRPQTVPEDQSGRKRETEDEGRISLEQIAVKNAFSKLSEDDREILILQRNGFSSAEIGDMVNRSASAVRSKVAVARRNFRECLKEEGVDVDG